MPKSDVYNCDCMDYMRNLPDKYFQLAVADPPYGGAGNKKYDGGGRFGQRFDRYKKTQPKALTSNLTARARRTGCINTEDTIEAEEPG